MKKEAVKDKPDEEEQQKCRYALDLKRKKKGVGMGVGEAECFEFLLSKLPPAPVVVGMVAE